MNSKLAAALHVATLCAFALAQPLYDLLEHNAEFFVAHRSQPSDILLLAALLSLVLPGVLLTALLLVPGSVRPIARAVLIGGLASLVAVQAANRVPALAARHIVPAGLVAGIAFGAAYARLRPV